MAKEPTTPAEWREAVDTAYFALVLDSCYQYGLLTGPKVDVARAEDIIDRGAALGYVPRSLDDILDEPPTLDALSRRMLDR